MRIADLSTEAIRCFVSGAGVVHRDPGGTDEPSTQHIADLGEEPSWLPISKRPTWLFEMKMPRLCNSVTSRGTVHLSLSKHETAQFRPK